MLVHRAHILVLSGLLYFGAARAAEIPTPKTVVYLGGILIDGTAASPRRVAIGTRGDRIIFVKPADMFRAEAGQDIVDDSGKFIIPGLINTHVHLATMADPPAAKAYLRRELYSGITSVRDMAGDARLIGELKREAEFDEIAAPDIVFAAVFAGPEFFVDPRSHQSSRGRVAGETPWMRAVTPATDLKMAVAEARGTGAAAIKIYADLPASLVDSIASEAHRQHMQVWAHAAVFPALPSEVVDAGIDVISHACMLGFEIAKPIRTSFEHGPNVGTVPILKANPDIEALMLRIKQRGTILDATVNTYDSDPTPTCPDGVVDYLTQRAYQLGIPISAGTDDELELATPFSNLDNEITLLVTNVGMSTADAIRSATFVGARAMGLEKSVGTVEAGKLANFVVLDRNPLDDIANIRTVSVVVKHGIRYSHSDFVPATSRLTQVSDHP